MGVEIAGKTLGVVGLGNIGRQAAERGVGLKMNVIGYDPFPPKQLPAGVKLVTLDELIAKSDFITLHVPLTPETKNLFGAATFAKMKKGAVPHQLRARRHRRRGRGARGAEVGPARRARPSTCSARSRRSRRRCSQHENLIASPHLGASTQEAQEKVAIELAEVFVGFLKDGIVRNAVK